MHANPSIGQYLIERLQAQGIRDVFGIPGDFVLGFYQMLEQSPLRVIGTCNELNAGYAADAYARLHGMGAVCVTYNVGGLSLVNAVAGAYAEKSALVVITGSPGMAERRGNPLLHHRVGAFSTQRDIFEKVTVAAVVLDDPETAFREIDRCLELARLHQRPVYIEIPRDMVEVVPPYPHKALSLPRESEPEALREAIAEARELLGKAKRPVILAGLEVHRCRLGDTVMAFAERHRIPICSTILSKSVIDERHPLYLGVYEGAMSREAVQRYVEDSDCLILLGVFMTDMELGIYTATLNPENWIFASLEDLRIRHHHFHQVQFSDFVHGLAAAELPARSPPESLPSIPPRAAWKPVPSAPVTNRRLFEKLDGILDERMVVVCDVGDALFASVDLGTQGATQFLGPAYYTSMGFAVPAALAVQVHDRNLRPLVIVGDGAFQMTGHELSSIARLGFNPIVLVLNNKGYTTERYLAEGRFNDIHPWHYHRMPELLGSGLGLEVHTEDELELALARAVAHTGAFTLINIHLDRMDISPALERLTRGIRESL